MVANNTTADADTAALLGLTDELVAAHFDYALAVARRFGRYLPWLRDDLESEALFQLLVLVRQHIERPFVFLRGAIGLRLSQRLSRRIDAERIWNRVAFCRPKPRAKGGVRETEVVHEVCGFGFADALDPRPTGQHEYEDREQLDADLRVVFQLLDAIPEHRSELLLRVLCDGELSSEIERETGLGPRSLSSAVWRAIRKLRSLGGIEVGPGRESVAGYIGVADRTCARVSAGKRKRTKVATTEGTR